MEYITFMHSNVDSEPTDEEWARFFDVARESGLFRGGSALGERSTIGPKDVTNITDHIGGYMRFDAESIDVLSDLLAQHPIIMHGGTIEICELPKT